MLSAVRRLRASVPNSIKDVFIRELLKIIRDNVASAKAKDYDGKTSFTLLIETPNADIECINELLMNSLPIDPLTEEWVSSEGTLSSQYSFLYDDVSWIVYSVINTFSHFIFSYSLLNIHVHSSIPSFLHFTIC